jgi:hypothetical protein
MLLIPLLDPLDRDTILLAGRARAVVAERREISNDDECIVMVCEAVIGFCSEKSLLG